MQSRLPFPISDAIVLTMGVEGGLTKSDFASNSSNTDPHHSFHQFPQSPSLLLDAVKHDVWASVQHLSVAHDSIFIHAATVKELCAKRIVHLGTSSVLSDACSAAEGTANKERLMTVSGLGPTLIDVQKLRFSPSSSSHAASAGNSASAHLRTNYAAAASVFDLADDRADAIIGGGSGAGGPATYSTRTARDDLLVSNCEDIIIVAVIHMGGRPDTSVILSALKAATNRCGSQSHSYSSSSSLYYHGGTSSSASAGGLSSNAVGKSLFFRKTTNVLLASRQQKSLSSSTFCLAPILHNCIFGGSVFTHARAGARSSSSSLSSLTPFSISKSTASGVGSVNQEKQHSIDAIILQNLPYFHHYDRNAPDFAASGHATGHYQQQGAGPNTTTMLLGGLNSSAALNRTNSNQQAPRHNISSYDGPPSHVSSVHIAAGGDRRQPHSPQLNVCTFSMADISEFLRSHELRAAEEALMREEAALRDAQTHHNALRRIEEQRAAVEERRRALEEETGSRRYAAAARVGHIAPSVDHSSASVASSSRGGGSGVVLRAATVEPWRSNSAQNYDAADPQKYNNDDGQSMMNSTNAVARSLSQTDMQSESESDFDRGVRVRSIYVERCGDEDYHYGHNVHASSPRQHSSSVSQSPHRRVNPHHTQQQKHSPPRRARSSSPSAPHHRYGNGGGHSHWRRAGVQLPLATADHDRRHGEDTHRHDHRGDLNHHRQDHSHDHHQQQPHHRQNASIIEANLDRQLGYLSSGHHRNTASGSGVNTRIHVPQSEPNHHHGRLDVMMINSPHARAQQQQKVLDNPPVTFSYLSEYRRRNVQPAVFM